MPLCLKNTEFTNVGFTGFYCAVFSDVFKNFAKLNNSIFGLAVKSKPH